MARLEAQVVGLEDKGEALARDREELTYKLKETQNTLQTLEYEREKA